MSLAITDNYITAQEAESVLNYLNGIFAATPGERGIKRFGLTNSYSSNKISSEIPEALNYLVQKLIDDGFATEIRHVTVNRYDPGQSIPFHTDSKEAGDVITIISLNSDCVMLFKKGKNAVAVTVPANSLTQFKGSHRWDMKHSIQPVSKLRYSIVFRKH